MNFTVLALKGKMTGNYQECTKDTCSIFKFLLITA